MAWMALGSSMICWRSSSSFWPSGVPRYHRQSILRFADVLSCLADLAPRMAPEPSRSFSAWEDNPDGLAGGRTERACWLLPTYGRCARHDAWACWGPPGMLFDWHGLMVRPTLSDAAGTPILDCFPRSGRGRRARVA